MNDYSSFSRQYQEGKYTIRVYTDSTKEWYLNGALHREDGPAVEWSDGTKEWYVNGKKHRENGPAVECSAGNKEWWINDREYTKEVYYSIMWNNISRQAKLGYIYGL